MINPCRRLILAVFLVLVLTTGEAAKPTSDVQQFLSVQNAARAALKLPPLVWDPNIARYAAWYANQRRVDCELEHSNGPYGENIFWGSGNRWTAAQAAAAWVSERREYNYWSNSCVYGRNVGIIRRLCGRIRGMVRQSGVLWWEGVFMICNYDPPGNYIGERPY
ncbi:Pathogenesis-related protein PR-1 [Sesamum angolense]|uniref:Pathogenesis-related protein PR-1 n=1 Tax=Sesamum angolense TaxID=2727404 RepID=A0AAE1X399_9LAMI|nr:Pathogenesis-related protein PR-1 [Sesamum angolense]